MVTFLVELGKAAAKTVVVTAALIGTVALADAIAAPKKRTVRRRVRRATR